MANAGRNSAKPESIGSVPLKVRQVTAVPKGSRIDHRTGEQTPIAELAKPPFANYTARTSARFLPHLPSQVRRGFCPSSTGCFYLLAVAVGVYSPH